MLTYTETYPEIKISPKINRASYEDSLLEFVTGVIGNDTENLFWGSKETALENIPLSVEFKGLGVTTLLNEIGYINDFLRTLNQHLSNGEYVVLLIETKHDRAKKLYKRHPKPFGYFIYTIDFITHRIFPKIWPTKKLYYQFSKGKNRTLSLTESLARIVFFGFELQEYKYLEDYAAVVAKKTSEPVLETKVSRGMIIQLPRIGKNGDIIQVYKLRTMHPYSEFLQEYVYEKHGTKDGDKIVNDFRVTRWGKIFRKFWLDEVPMLLNWLKRDLKLIGVRPLSKHKFNTYPETLQKERVKYKPGMIPPYYAELPKTPKEFFETEWKYLSEYKKKPIRTDLKYLFKSLYNIIFKGIRSM